MSKQDNSWYDRQALCLHRSAQKIYYDALSQKIPSRIAYELASASFGDEKKYQKLKRKYSYGR